MSLLICKHAVYRESELVIRRKIKFPTSKLLRGIEADQLLERSGIESAVGEGQA